MTGFNISLSVLKRDSREIGEVDQILKNNGWTMTASVGPGDRIRYYEQAGFNITAIGGPSGTVILPSGPLRGRIFGDGVFLASSEGTLGETSTVKNNSESPNVDPGVMT